MSIIDTVVLLFLTFLYYQVFIRMSVFLHELGHAFSARLLGAKSIHVGWGKGKLLLQRKLGKISLTIYKSFLKEGTSSYDISQLSVIKKSIILFSGPLVNMILLLLAISLFPIYGEWHLLDSITLGLALSNLYLVSVNLVPMQVKSLDRKQKFPNDGLSILLLWK